MRPEWLARPETAVAKTIAPRRDLALAVLGLLLLLVLLASGQTVVLLQPLRAVLGLVYILYVPGYCLVAALFPRPSDLDGPERIAASFGSSIAIVPPVSLILNLLPWGIRLWPMAVSLGTVILLCSAVAWYRRGRLSVEDCTALTSHAGLREWSVAQSARTRLLSISLATLLVAIVGAVLTIVLLPATGAPTTEFYLLGPGGLAEDYPGAAIVGQPVTVSVGIANQEGVSSDYRVDVLDGRNPIGHLGPIRVEPGTRVERSFSFVPDEAGDVEVRFYLYRDEGAAPYRNLRLWLNIRES